MTYSTYSPNDSLTESKINGAKDTFVGGYDGVGKIEAVGEDITDLTPGDNVALFLVPQRGPDEHNSHKSNIGDDYSKTWRDGSLWTPKSYRTESGEELSGFMGVGTWSEYVVIPETHVIKLESEPDHVDSGIGSVLATGMMAAEKAAGVEEGSNVCVIGDNSVAMILSYALKQGFGCETVTAVSSPELKDMVESFGANHVSIDQSTEDIQKAVMEIIPDGYDYTFESSSFSKFGQLALEICHKGFGVACLLSQPSDEDEKIKTRPFMLVTGRHWVSFLQGNVKTQDDGAAILKHVANMKESLGKHIFKEENIVSVDSFPEKVAELTAAPFARAIIKF